MIPALCRTSVAGRCTCTWASSEESTNTSTSCLTTSTSLSFPSPSTPPWWRYTSRLSGHSAVSVKTKLFKRRRKQSSAFTEHSTLGFIFSTHKHFPSLESGPTNCKTLAWYSCGTVTKWWSTIRSIPLVTPSWFNWVGLLILSVDPVCLGRLKPRGSTATPQPRAKTRSSRLWRAWCLAALMSSKFPQMWVNPLCLHAKAFRSVTFKPRHQTFSFLLLFFKIE